MIGNYTDFGTGSQKPLHFYKQFKAIQLKIYSEKIYLILLMLQHVGSLKLTVVKSHLV